MIQYCHHNLPEKQTPEPASKYGKGELAPESDLEGVRGASVLRSYIFPRTTVYTTAPADNAHTWAV